jgi:hypothetical protein
LPAASCGGPGPHPGHPTAVGGLPSSKPGLDAGTHDLATDGSRAPPRRPPRFPNAGTPRRRVDPSRHDSLTTNADSPETRPAEHGTPGQHRHPSTGHPSTGHPSTGPASRPPRPTSRTPACEPTHRSNESPPQRATSKHERPTRQHRSANSPARTANRRPQSTSVDLGRDRTQTPDPASRPPGPASCCGMSHVGLWFGLLALMAPCVRCGNREVPFFLVMACASGLAESGLGCGSPSCEPA